MLKGWTALENYTGFSRKTLKRKVRNDGWPIKLGGPGRSPPIASKAALQIFITRLAEDQKEKK